MKWYLIAFSFFLTEVLYSQDYQEICSPGITFFQAPDGYLAAFRRDSVIPAGNNDTLFLSYRAIRDSVYYSCKDTTNGSILGIRVFKRHDGYFFFFNMHQDTLKLNTQAGLNEPWSFFDLGNGDRIEAVVTDVVPDTILGMPDPVKVIVLQAKNSSGQNIPHILNGKEIRLSQHYGLTLMYDTYLLPDDTSAFSLAGKTSIPIGLSDITAADIFNFDIGDEFHYSGIDQYPGSAYRDYWIIKKILSKEIIGNNDSVAYQEEYCKHSLLFTPEGVFTYNYYDTITEGFNLENNPNLQRLPAEFAPAANNSGFDILEYKRKATDFGGKITQEVYSGDYFTPDPPCWNPPFEGSGMDYYSVGLGSSGYMYGWWAGTGMETHSLSLVYYKKGSEEWGIPVATDCNTLVPVQEQEKNRTVEVTVIPNPVESSAEISITGAEDLKELKFCLFDLMGRSLKCLAVTGNPVLLERNGLFAGMYIAILTGPDGRKLWTGKILVR